MITSWLIALTSTKWSKKAFNIAMLTAGIITYLTIMFCFIL